jgi:hypothetical protein
MFKSAIIADFFYCAKEIKIMTEISEIMSKPGRVVDWASKVKYNTALDGEGKEISAVMDQWARGLGDNGDKDHELAALINKSITPDTVAAPTALIDAMFDQNAIGEFDDKYDTQVPENTIKVYDAAKGGTVDRSFIEHKVLKPTYVHLQAETDIRMADMRRGGYKTVSNIVTYVQEAMELTKYAKIMNIVDNAVVSGAANYFAESTALPTEANMDKMVAYLMDMSDGDLAQIFGFNKYILAIGGYDKAQKFASDAVKNQFCANGILATYGGAVLTGVTGTRKLANGSLLLPDKKVFAAAGKVGEVVTRGNTRTLEADDINNETIHIKVTGYEFGVMLTRPNHLAKIVMAQ